MPNDDAPLILVVDDSPQMRTLLCRSLHREGFRTAEAANGKEALQKACELVPNLVLMDIQMPVMDGFEAISEMRASTLTAHVPIIVVTAAARDAHDLERGLSLGADDYIVKPYNLRELIARIRGKLKVSRPEETLNRCNEQLQILARISAQLVRALSLNELSDYLLEALCQHLRADGAILMLLDSQKQPSYWRVFGKPLHHIMHLVTTWLPVYITHGEPVTLADTRLLPPEMRDAFEADAIRSGIAVPLRFQEHVTGALALASQQACRFSDDDLKLLETVASQAALAIHNAQLYGELQDHAKNLEATVRARTEELTRAQQQLMRADRLAALGTLAAGIAHEINNPLQPLLTNLELMLEDLEQGRPADRELIESAVRDVQRIKRIVSGLLDFARPARSTLTVLQISTVVHEVLALAHKQLEQARIQTRLCLEAQRYVRGDADQLKQVVLNLVINAMEAMPNGGELRLETAEQRREGTPWLRLSVVDTGVGIPPENIDQIFDPFYTTKPHGTGLGLAISHAIIAAHGGQIYAESKPGQTTFTVYLPVVEGE